MKLEDITLERVKLAYRRTGETPGHGPGSYSNLDNDESLKYACALEALARDGEGHNWANVLPPPIENTAMFFAGFDNDPKCPYADKSHPAYIKGREIAIGLGLIND